ncbi:MAG TPA: protein phosphatase 2C domain-containing protein [Pseudonocardiaceae bacterium]|nr:protein phosphatase 2C domain-containing protein [Pseudonocardiaceae bacterium]
MTDSEVLQLRSVAHTDPGLHRSNNEDSGYVSARLLVVADGMGGHAYGEVASSTAVGILAELDKTLPAEVSEGEESPDLLEALGDAIKEIGDRLTNLAQEDAELATMGTTVTAFLWDGESQFAIAHIGDSRAYLLRGDQYGQLTRDHTLVQSLVDEGKLTPEQAAVHPRRSVLMRALQSGGTSEPDLYYWQAEPGDRYLLCSDGLSDVVPDELVGQVLASIPDPDDAAATFIDLAKQGGGPDNITCIIADLVTSSAEPISEPLIIGAAESQVVVEPEPEPANGG